MNTIPKETNSKAKIGFMYLESVFIIGVYLLLSYIFSAFINSKLIILYVLFSVYVAFMLGLPSKDCKKRLGLYAIIVYLRKERSFYKMSENISKSNYKKKGDDEGNENEEEFKGLEKHFGFN